ncbi:hypothetical protein ACIBJE_02220 [Micromonospora sp. NPDC050187]|uniref:hypothetical protein n=1 Tax=Micromonospora sp. NPDC050187 TaxID=3364277 RepID=UPI00379FA0A5
MTARAVLAEVLAAERTRPPVGEVHPLHVSLRRATADDLLWPDDIPRTPLAPRPDPDVLRMAGYGWSARQIAALLRLDITTVLRILAHHGRGPAPAPDPDIEEEKRHGKRPRDRARSRPAAGHRPAAARRPVGADPAGPPGGH